MAEASGLGPEGWGFDSLQRHQLLENKLSITLQAEFYANKDQTVCCILNGMVVNSCTVSKGNSVIEFNLVHLQDDNHLRFYFLENTGIVRFVNTSLDELDFYKTYGYYSMHTVSNCHLIDRDGSKKSDTVHTGNELPGPGFFSLDFTQPIENWFFLKWQNNAKI